MMPAERSMKMLRSQGFVVDKAEKWIPFPKPRGTRQDLFGFADLIVLTDRIVAIQCCAFSGISAHAKKIKSIHAAKMWLLAGGELLIDGWRKIDGHWQVSIREARLVDGVIEFVKLT